MKISEDDLSYSLIASALLLLGCSAIINFDVQKTNHENKVLISHIQTPKTVQPKTVEVKSVEVNNEPNAQGVFLHSYGEHAIQNHNNIDRNVLKMIFQDCAKTLEQVYKENKNVSIDKDNSAAGLTNNLINNMLPNLTLFYIIMAGAMDDPSKIQTELLINRHSHDKNNGEHP